MIPEPEQQKTPDSDKLAVLQERLSAEKQRHAAAVAAIKGEIDATQEGARSLIEGGQEPAAEQKRELSAEQKEALLGVFQRRLNQKAVHYERPEGINFADVRRALEASPVALWSLSRMEETGGEPDIVAVEDNAFVFADCSAESPTGRRNCVYDSAAEEIARVPCQIPYTFNGNAVQMAEEFGVEMWSPEFYCHMQTTGEFDSNAWSWLNTDAKRRSTGDARYGDRYGVHARVSQFAAHYHSVWGAWRGLLRVQRVS